MPWSKDKRRPNKRKRTLASKAPREIPDFLKQRMELADVVIGADECGWGCIAGPIVVAACVMPAGYNGPRLRDSKKYSSERSREEAEKLVKQHCLRYEVVAVSAFTVAHMGPAASLNYAYRKAIETVLEGTEYENPLIVVDGSKKVEGLDRKHYTLPKGDDILFSISAASILGKCWRDRYMTDLDKLFPEYKFGQHKGYMTQAHFEATKKYGVTREHRRNIEFVKETLEKVGKYSG